VKQRLLPILNPGAVPDLLSPTMIVLDIILEDLDRMIHLTVDPARCHYAVLGGVQIHGPNDQTFIWPGVTYAVVNQKRLDLSSAMSKLSLGSSTVESKPSQKKISLRNLLRPGIHPTNSFW